LIISFKDELSLQRMEKLCRGERLDWTIEGFPDAAEICQFAKNPCRRFFRRSIFGVSGNFTTTEVDLIERCLPDGVSYIESDALVFKTEGPQRSLLDLPTVEKMSHEPVTRGRSGGTRRVPRINRPGQKTQDVHVALWNLDRIDQRDLPLDKKYHYGSNTTIGTGSGVNVYILDSGIHPTHREFLRWNGNGTRASYGYDFVDEDEIAEDCDGHGTHVASTAVGRSVGIAKQANVIGVRVLDCQGSGNISTTVAGLDWVTANYQKPAVVALSLGVSIGRWSQSLEDSVKTLINKHGIPVVVASGNSGVDSCYVAPANVPETITVAASDLDTKFGITQSSDAESIYRWSNTGKCVDIFAPGVDIYGACGGPGRCDEVTLESYTWASGTSMAVPHVAGVAALYLGDFPLVAPARLKREIISKATNGKIVSELVKEGTPNRLLYSNVLESVVIAANGRRQP
jgi:subtilisin family serine protease